MLLATTDVSYSGGYLSPAEQQQTWSPDFYARSKQTSEKRKGQNQHPRVFSFESSEN